MGEYQNPLEAEEEVLHIMGVPVSYLPVSQARRPNLVTLVELAVRLRRRREKEALPLEEKTM